MMLSTHPDAVWIHTQVFEHWSVTIPRALQHVPDVDGPYWHARDAHRSVSLTSYVLTEAGAPVPSAEIVSQVGTGLLPRGQKVTERPSGLAARAVIARAPSSSVASRMLQGLVMPDGYLLMVTITAEDSAWCRRVWMSIRHHP